MSAYANKSDLELASFIEQGNEFAFAELVGRHTSRFFALAYRTLQNQSDAEDVIQTAFIKFWQRPHLWNADKSKFTTWFYRVVINACHDLQRSGVKHKVLEYSLNQQSAVMSESEESGAEKRESEELRRKCVESGIRALPTSQRDVLNLVVYCEIAQKEAADILGINLKALESLLHRAKKSLAKHVQESQFQERSGLNSLSNRHETVVYREK